MEGPSSLNKERYALSSEGTVRGTLSVAALAALISHSLPSATSHLISDLVSHRDSFGAAWLLVWSPKRDLPGRALSSVDLSRFALGPGKLGVFLSALSSQWIGLDMLTCGPRVCMGGYLTALCRFLRGVPAERERRPCLKTLSLSECALDDLSGAFLIQSLPPSVEHLNLSGNGLRVCSMNSLSSLLSLELLPHLSSLDLSRNPLGPSGLAALSTGLSSPPQSLQLESLRLSNTRAKAEGVQVLSEALKCKKVVCLKTIDLSENQMKAEGLRALASALSDGAAPTLRSLHLQHNLSALSSKNDQFDLSGLEALFSSTGLSEIEELDLFESSNEKGDQAIDQHTEFGNFFASAIAEGRLGKLRRLQTGVSGEEILTTFGTGILSGRSSCLQVLNLKAPEGVGVVGGMTVVSRGIEAGLLPRLIEVRLEGWRAFGGEGCLALCRSLARGSSPLLKSLEMTLETDSESEFDLEGGEEELDEIVTVLAAGVREGKFGSLENLGLEGGMGRASISRLCGSFGLVGPGGVGVSTLQRLRLRWTEAGDEGVGVLAEGLREGGGIPSLEHLSLDVLCGGGSGNRELGRVLSGGQFPSLKSLELRWFAVDSFGRLCDGLSFGRLPSHVAVDVFLRRYSDSEVWERDNAVVQFANAIREGKIPGLRRVVFGSGLGMGPGAGQMFGVSLTHTETCLASLEELSFCGGDFSTRGCSEGLSALLYGVAAGDNPLPSLHTLDLGVHDLGSRGLQGSGKGVRALSDLLIGSLVPSLKTVCIPLCSDVGIEGMQSVSNALVSPRLSTLRHLEVTFPCSSSSSSPDFPSQDRTELTVAQVDGLCKGLSSGGLKSLEELSFHGELSDKAVQSICTAIGAGKFLSLRVMDISRPRMMRNEMSCNVQPDSGDWLAGILSAERLPSLRTLKLNHTRLCEDSLRTVSDVWQTESPPPLELLHFGGCGISRREAVILADALGLGVRKLPFLWRLDLPKNDIPSDLQSIILLLLASSIDVTF